jgi:hypothetical protein
VTFDEFRALADAELGNGRLPGFKFDVRYANSTDFEVRLQAIAFDYYAALVARPDSLAEDKAAELEGLREQCIENILLGYASLRDGYPKAFGVTT